MSSARTFVVDGEPREIVGVMGPDFRFPSDRTAAWSVMDRRPAADALGQPGGNAVARVRPGVGIENLEQELTGLLRQLPDRFGQNAAYARILPHLQVVARPLREELVGAATQPIGLLFASTLIVLVIACANVGNLFAVRAESRRHEVAIRQAIGAQRGQIIRAQLAEVAIIAGSAAVLALGFAHLALPLFLSLAPANVPRLLTTTIGVGESVFTGLLALVAGLTCGLIPALRSSRVRSLEMRAATRSVTGRRLWERDALLAGQTALALVLLIGAALLIHSYARMRRVEPGYNTKDLYTFQIAPNQPGLKDGPSWARFHLDFTQRLLALPGVDSVGIVENVPLDEGTASGRFTADGAPADSAVRLGYTYAGPDYYATHGHQAAGRARALRGTMRLACAGMSW